MTDSTSDENGKKSAAAPAEVVVSLPAVFESDAIGDVYEELLQQLACRSRVVIDAADVVEISTAAVQLLLSAVTSFECEDLSLTYRNPSDSFIDVFSDLGLYAHLSARIDLGAEG